MRLSPTRNTAQIRKTVIKRPKKTTLPPCLRKRYCRSELDGKDDEDYPENDGTGTDQLDQTQEYNIRSYDQKCTQEHGEDSSQCQRPLLSNRQPSQEGCCDFDSSSHDRPCRNE